MKKVLILTSAGGGGHISVSNALTTYLNNTYEVKEVLVFKRILNSLDPLIHVVFRFIDGENIYNFFIRKKWYPLANLLYSTGAFYFTLRSRKIRKVLERYFAQEKPDLVISVIPIINHDIALATKKLAIPFLIIPTDLDATTFLYRISKPTYSHFKIALAFDDDDIRNIVEKNGILPEQIAITGFPLRTDFFKDKNKQQIYMQFAIPDDKPVILLLMGTQGSNDMYRFVKELRNLSTEAHLICCVGKNERIGDLIKGINLPENISVSVIGFTDQISDLMEIADLIITKSGSVSVCETLYMNKPHLLDATSSVLRWEKFNHYFTKKNGFGGILSGKAPILKQVEAVLSNKKLLTIFRNNLLAYEKKHPLETIRNLVAHMLLTNVPKDQKENIAVESYRQLSISTLSKRQ